MHHAPRRLLLPQAADLTRDHFRQATFPQQIFTLVNFAVLPFWGLMIAAPKWEVTERTMRSSWPILLCGAMHLAMVAYG